jgi:tetratricopeptide (TPR) repeat protein
MCRILLACSLFLVLPFSAFADDFQRGKEALDKGDYDAAIACFAACIRDNPKDAHAYNFRGIAYQYKKEYDKAIQDYSEAIDISPTDAVASNNRGTAYFDKKEYDKAIRDFSDAISINPKHPLAYNNLARLLATCPKDSVRDGNKAIKLATKACELSKWKVAAQLDTLAAAHAETKNFQEAVKWEKKALDLGFDADKDREKARQRLKLYEADKPYRED